MRWVFASLSSAVCLAGTLAGARPAAAQSTLASGEDGEWFTVTRAPGAESCPDAVALRARVEQVRGQQTTGAASAYHVAFAQQAGVFRASIRVGSSSSVRTLHDRGVSCAALEQATAVTLALLLDSEAAAEPSSEAPLPSPPPARPASLVPASPAPAREPPSARLTLSLGGSALAGVLRPLAPAAVADVGISVHRFRTTIGLLWLPRQELAFGPGRLELSLLGGAARTCLAPWLGRALRLDVCSGVYAGTAKASARGYTQNAAADKAWLAVPLELSLTTRPAPVGLELGATALLPLRREDFAIDNLGVAYESWPIGFALSLRVVGSWLL
jgi:hypothetical protein